MNEQLYRDQYAHYINTTPSAQAETWSLEGIGVEALALSYNAQVDQYKTIIQRNADATFKNYQIQSNVSGKRIYKGDAIYEFLDAARRQAAAIETQFLEIEMAYGTGTTSVTYPATKFNILIVMDEFLGEDATISYNIYVKGDPVNGTATIANGVPTFTESGD